MKMKRILTLILSAIVTFLALPAAVLAEDTSFSVSKEKVELLTYLGIVEEPSDETMFGVEVTRADFAVYVGNIIGINEKSECDKRYYTDLPEDHWAYNTINTMTERGYLHGTDGKFNPEESITYQQAIAMLLNSLGYNDIVESRGGWQSGYISVAQELDIAARGSGQTGNITFAVACELLHDSLLAPILEYSKMSESGATVVVSREKTVMEKYFDIYRVTGIVNSVYGVKVDTKGNGRKGVIRIDDTEYECEIADAMDFLGKRVYAYYEDMGDEKKVFLLSSRNDDDCLIINIEEFRSFNPQDFTITYLESGASRIKTQKVKSNSSVIRNGEDYSSKVRQAFENLNYGSIQLSSSKGNGDYDIVIVKNYTDLVVSSFDKTYEKIFDKKDSANFLDLRYTEEYRITDSEGKPINITDVEKDAVLSVCKSDNYCEIIVNTISYSGKIEKTDEGENNKYMVVTVDGANVPVDMTYYNTNTVLFNNSAKIKIYVNAFGFGIYAEPVTGDEFLIGWVIKAKASDSGETICNMTILTQDNKIEKLQCADIVRSSGTRLLDGAAIETKLGGSPVSGQLIRYKLDTDGRIHRIETADGLTHPANSELYQSGTTIASARYYSTNMMMGPTIKLTASSICFTIPDDITDLEGFSVLKGSELSNDRTYSNIIPYKTTDTTNTTEILVIGETTVGSWGKSMYLVDKIYDVLNEDDEVEKVADVYVNGVKHTVHEGRGFSFETNGVTSGDIWHFYTYPNGDIAPADGGSLRVVYDFETGKVQDINNGFSYEPYIGFGYITSIKEGVAKYGCKIVSEVAQYDVNEANWAKRGILPITGAPITVYDAAEKTIETGDESDLYEAMQEKNIIFVSQTFGAVQSIVVIKR